MKKKIAAAMILVLICAGSALAAPAAGRMHMGPGPVVNRAEITPEVRAKMDDMRALHAELRAELQKDAPDKAKAREIHDKIVALRGELSKDRFEQVLVNPKMIQQSAGQGRGPKRPEMTAAEKAKFGEMRELHRNIRTELQKEMPNKAKIRDWAKQAQVIKNVLDDMRLEEMLKDPAKYKDVPMFGPGPMPGPGPRGHRDGPCNCWTPAQQ